MKVDCNQCGALLTIDAATNFVTCVKCSSRLHVKRTGTAVFTEVLAPGLADLKEELARLDKEPAPSLATAAGGGGEAVLRIVVGALIIASDIYWWIIDPSLQQIYVRVILLAAGAWLVLSGFWRGIVARREKVKAMGEAKAARDKRRAELEHQIESSREA